MNPNILPNQPKPAKKDKSILLVFVILIVLVIVGAVTYFLTSHDDKSVNGLTSAQSKVVNSSKAESHAMSVKMTAEIYAVDNDHYPSSIADLMSQDNTSRIPSDVTIVSDSGISPINADNGTDYVAWSCLKTCINPTGGRITYWDYRTNSISKNAYYVGDANASSTFVYPSSGNDDLQRKNDLSRITTAVASYAANNRGALPNGMGSSITSWPSFVERYLKSSGDTFTDPSGKDYILSETAVLPSAFDQSNPVILLTVGAECDGSDLVIGQGTRKVAFQMRLEDDSIECVNN